MGTGISAQTLKGEGLPAHCLAVTLPCHQGQAAQKGCGGDRVARHRLPSKCLWISSTELVVPGDDSFTELLFDQMNALTVERQLEVTR